MVAIHQPTTARNEPRYGSQKLPITLQDGLILTLFEDAPSPSSSLTVPSPRELDVPSHLANRELMRRLVSTVPWDRLSNPPNICSSSRTTAALIILMPEKYEGQHLTLSSALSDSKHKGRDRLILELFLLSNNFVRSAPGEQSEESMLEDGERVMEMFNESGWKNVKHIQMLLSTHEPTASAIAEKIFASAIRLFDMETVKMMLEAGMDANATVDTIHNGPLSSLQFASTMKLDEGLELVQLLLSNGADVNLLHNGNYALDFAIRKNRKVARVLLDHGAMVTPSCLSTFVRYSKIYDFAREIINACPDVNERTGWQEPSALTYAVWRENAEMIDMLLARGAEVNDLIPIDFDWDLAVTTVLGVAVRSTKLHVIQPLLWACRNTNPEFDGFPYVSPLALAVESGNAEVTRLLLQAGMNIEAADEQGNMTLLERATKKNPSLLRVLIEYGARIDRPLSDTKHPHSVILVAITKKNYDLVEFLINVGARLNDEYSQPPGTVLGAAIEIGDTLLIEKLLAAGARVLKGQLRRIGNIHTAMYLQQRAVLQRILQISGPEILASALSAKDDLFSHYLIEHDADIAKEFTNSQDYKSQKTPLGTAIQKGNFVIAETLLSRGAEITDSNLADAMSYLEDDAKFVQRLLSRFRGSAPTAVSRAVSNGQQHLEVLREANVDPTGAPELFEDTLDLQEIEIGPPQSVLEIAVVLNDEALSLLLQWTPWDPRLTGRALAIAIVVKKRDAIDSLLACGPDMQQEVTIRYCEDNEDETEITEIFTPLQAAVKGQLVPLAQHLAKSADLNYLGDGARRRTPLQHAVEKGNMELIKMLLQHGARVDGPPARDGGATALQIASFQGYIGIARRLIDLGADVNEAPARFNGRTALQGAADYGRIDMLQMLLDEGTLIVGDGEQQYQKAVDLAERNGHKAAARLLRSFRSSVQLSTP